MAKKRIEIEIAGKAETRAAAAEAIADIRKVSRATEESRRQVAATIYSPRMANLSDAAGTGNKAATTELLKIEARIDRKARELDAQLLKQDRMSGLSDKRAGAVLSKSAEASLQERLAGDGDRGAQQAKLISAERAYRDEVRGLRAVMKDANSDLADRVAATRALQQVEERRATTVERILKAGREETTQREEAAAAESARAKADADSHAAATIERGQANVLRGRADAGDGQAGVELEVLQIEKSHRAEAAALLAISKDENVSLAKQNEATKLLLTLNQQLAATVERIHKTHRDDLATQQAAAKAEEAHARSLIASVQQNEAHEDFVIDRVGARAKMKLEQAEPDLFDPSAHENEKPDKAGGHGHASGRASLGAAQVIMPAFRGHENMIYAAVGAAKEYGLALAGPVGLIAALALGAKHVVDANFQMKESQIAWNRELRESAENWREIARAQNPVTAAGGQFAAGGAEYRKKSADVLDDQAKQFRELNKYGPVIGGFGTKVGMAAEMVGNISFDQDKTSFRQDERLGQEKARHAEQISKKLKAEADAQRTIQLDRNTEDRRNAVQVEKTSAMYEGPSKRRAELEGRIGADRVRIQRENSDKATAARVADELARADFYKTHTLGSAEGIQFEAGIYAERKKLTADGEAELATADERAGIARAALDRNIASEREKAVTAAQADMLALQLEGIDKTAEASIERYRAASAAEIKELEKDEANKELVEQKKAVARQTIANMERQHAKAQVVTRIDADATIGSIRISSLRAEIDLGNKAAELEAKREELRQQEIADRKKLQDLIDNPDTTADQKQAAKQAQAGLGDRTKGMLAAYQKKTGEEVELNALQVRSQMGDKAAAIESTRLTIAKQFVDTQKQLTTLAEADPSRKAQLDKQSAGLLAAKNKALVEEKTNALQDTRLTVLKLQEDSGNRIAAVEIAKLETAKKYKEVQEQIVAQLARADLTAGERASLQKQQRDTETERKKAMKLIGSDRNPLSESGFKSEQLTKDMRDQMGRYRAQQQGYGREREAQDARLATAKNTAATASALKSFVDMLSANAKARAFGEASPYPFFEVAPR